MTYEVTINPDVTFGFPIKVYKGEDRELALHVLESYIKAGEHPRIIESTDGTTKTECDAKALKPCPFCL